ncbi:MAG: DUF3987 domain-containing protein [Acidobacteria bacterium]|nr:DUF3987 domain-containing protein [Acidobacteriota bacterium]
MEMANRESLRLLRTALDDPEGVGLPAPFYNFETPDFPLNAMPPWLKAFVEKLAASSQTPVDLAALLSLAVCSASVARNVRIEARSGWEEPLNIFAVVALPPQTEKAMSHQK